MFSKRSSLRQPTSLHSQHPTTPILAAFFALHSCERPSTTPFKGVDKTYDLSPLLPPLFPPLIEVRLLNRSTKQRHPAAYHGGLTDGRGGEGGGLCSAGDLEELRGQAYRHLLFHQGLPYRRRHEQAERVGSAGKKKKSCSGLGQNHRVF